MNIHSICHVSTSSRRKTGGSVLAFLLHPLGVLPVLGSEGGSSIGQGDKTAEDEERMEGLHRDSSVRLSHAHKIILNCLHDLFSQIKISKSTGSQILSQPNVMKFIYNLIEAKVPTCPEDHQ